MQPIRLAALGAMLLCAVLSATACSTSGKPREVAYEQKVVEAAKQQLVPISSTLTEIPALQPPPTPSVPYGPNCSRPTGCYSNQQLESLLSAALDWGGKLTDNLRAIRRAGELALKPAPSPPQ